MESLWNIIVNFSKVESNGNTLNSENIPIWFYPAEIYYYISRKDMQFRFRYIQLKLKIFFQFNIIVFNIIYINLETYLHQFNLYYNQFNLFMMFRLLIINQDTNIAYYKIGFRSQIPIKLFKLSQHSRSCLRGDFKLARFLIRRWGQQIPVGISQK